MGNVRTFTVATLRIFAETIHCFQLKRSGKVIVTWVFLKAGNFKSGFVPRKSLVDIEETPVTSIDLLFD